LLISAKQYLSEKGIIILDDSQNEEYNSMLTSCGNRDSRGLI
jgi:hypothetical protein